MANGLFTLKQQVYATEVGAWPNQKTLAVDYLVVAGGGSGGGGYGTGGGAGGMLVGNIPVVTNSAITVTIGAGAAGAANANGNTGANSVFGNILTNGGGFGVGGWGNRAGSGGSGGGSGGNTASRLWGEAVPGQGNRGGAATAGTGPGQSGGGGAGTAGGDGFSEAQAGSGGNGLGTYIGGPLAVYAGGGGGGIYNNTTANNNGLGGAGGGGNGGAPGSNNGSPGTANTGGGGGGASVQPGNTTTGGNGGSGIVILSYPDVYQAPTATTGSPTVSTSGSGSFALNGSSYIKYAGQTPFAFGTGDFTIEMWLYVSVLGTFLVPIDFRPNLNGAYPYIYKSTDNRLYYYANTTVAISGTTALTTGVWYHVVVCRSGTSTKMYLNGTQEGSTYSDTTNYIVGNPGPTIFAESSNLYSWNGNASNVRIVKGVCVYTGNFTPPTAPLTATQSAGTNIAAITGTQTSLLLSSVSGAQFADSSSSGYYPTVTGTPTWNQLSPFATGLGFKNRVYTWTSSGSITF
jgi:hypothetical protein